MTAPPTSIMVIGLLFLLLGVPMLDGCPVVRISDNHPPSQGTQMTTYTLTDMKSSGYPVHRSDTSDWYLYHFPDKWVIGKTVGATEEYSMYVKSDHFNADEITGTFFIRYHGVWRESPNVRVSCTVENVALGKPASQSSTDGSNTADLAVDGEKGMSVPDGQCTLTNAEVYSWWEVDLGRDYSVLTVRVLNRGDCCGRLLENFVVRIKGEWQSWESSEICGAPYRQKLSNGQSITVDCGRPIVGRHVRIQLPAGSDADVLSVCEVEVFPSLGCPDGYIVHGGFCYKPHNTPMTRQNAQATCQQDGGTLAMPRHRHTNEFLTETAIRGNTQSRQWIGLTNQNGSWVWGDGNPLCGFRGWGAGLPSMANNCALLLLDGSWQDESCDATATFVCQVQPPVNLADVGYQPFGGAFLPAFPVRMKFEEAKAACDRFGGGRLAQPTTREFNDRLMSVAGETSPDESFWIGLKMYEDFWLWSDGTPSETSYSNWAPGEPSGEGCVTTTSAGEWSVKNCDETAFYICQIGDESLCEMEPHTTVRCGGTVSGSSGHILSPGYGQHLNIPDELDCEWKIPVPAGMVIKFTVVEFQVEGGSLEIFDFCPYGRSVKILSGSVESSLNITNNADEAFLKFSSNGLQPTYGFNISYQAIQRPPGLQISQGDTGTRQKRAVLAGLAIKTGLKKVASFVSDILFNIAGLVFDAVGSASVEGEQQHQEVMEKLNLLERKIDGIHEEIQELGIITELLHEKEIAAQRYSESEQRIKNLHDTLHNRLQITVNGTLEPASLAQGWVETVLRQDSEGMNQALNNMHAMVMGTMSVFHGKSVIETLDALLRRQNHPNAAEKLKSICEYIIDLQLSGYVAWILALKQNGEMDRADEVMKRAYNKLSEQSCFMARFFYDWPAGTYGLPMASGGCPGGFEDGQYEFKRHDSFYWQEGDPLYLDGSVSRNAVKQGVCMKTNASDNEENWPKGSYCIYKYGNCPVGFRWGRLGFPGGAKTGVVPDGSVSGDGIKVEFCCRDDGFASNPIRLPARSPFPLLRHGGECQQVDGADVRQGWIEYRGNGHRAGMTPDDDGDDTSHRLYYCSYSVPGSIVNIPATRVISAAMPVHTTNVLGFVAFVTVTFVTVL